MKKIINVLPILILTLFFLSKNSFAQTNNLPKAEHDEKSVALPIRYTHLENGDLIFVGAENEGLSGAIKRSTSHYASYNFDHIGIIEKTKDSLFVLHAAPKGGSQREELHQFYNNQKTSENLILIYRLKKEYQPAIPAAIQKAKTMLGKPYNWKYILNDEAYYCSDFVERAFREAGIFEHIPMNFKNLTTGEIDDFWVNLYQQMNTAVPQGEPGSNPNQLSTSSKLDLYGSLELLWSK